MIRRLISFSLCSLFVGCAQSSRDRAWVARELLERTGSTTDGKLHSEIPEGVNIEDGLDESEVVSIVLWRNPGLRAELTRIDAARSTLDEASRPANPQLSLLGPIGAISAVATLLIPLESLLQIPDRTDAAAREADAVGESVLMRALDLVREARWLHIDLGLAADRALLRRNIAQISLEVARLATIRATVGEISPMEAKILAADAQACVDAADSAEMEISMARARLAATLAIDEPQANDLQASFAIEVTELPDLRDLMAFARIARPDARSAESAISAAAAAIELEKSKIIQFSALAEAHWHQPSGPAQRVGARADLPIFAQGQGPIGRAEAQWVRALAQLEQTSRTITMDVQLSCARFSQATRSRQRFETEVLPSLDAGLEIARRGLESGDQDALSELDALRRTKEARLRRAELIAEQRRSTSDVERAIGARLHLAPIVASRVHIERSRP